MPEWLQELVPIGLLLLVVTFVVMRLPKVEIGHTDAFRQRRLMNWLPLGLTYAFLYMGRYNLTAAKNAGALTGEQFGDIFGWGAMVYGLSFFLNGPIADRYGGRITILISSMGSALANLAMGVLLLTRTEETNIVPYFIGLYAINMYFQSFGAVSIVKVNSAWFHVKERGVFGGIFGVLISLGIYFAFDGLPKVVEGFGLAPHWLFFLPAGVLFAAWFVDFGAVRALPSDAGHVDFDTGDASSGDDGPQEHPFSVLKRMLSSPIILTIAAIEFCSGFLRNAIMHWYRDLAKGLSLTDQFVYDNWGMLLCVAGIFGGMFAGVISDRVFQSRRGPVAGVLYGLMLVGCVGVYFGLNSPLTVGYIVVFMSMCVIGVHGMLSGTASMDFGGKRNAGIAVGLIDGCVYLGTTLQSFMLGRMLPEHGTVEATQAENWTVWPLVMAPMALIGFMLTLRMWNAKPKPKAGVEAADSG